MAKQTLTIAPTEAHERELEITLEAALMMAQESETALAKVAEQIYRDERALIENFEQQWVMDRLLWILRRKQKKLASGPGQMVLPGFEKLPRRITFANGKRCRTMSANVTELRRFRAQLWKKKDASIGPLDKLIELMAPYDEKQPGITAYEVIDSEAKKLERHP